MPHLIQHPLGPFWVWPDSVGRDLALGRFWDAHLQPIMDATDPTGWALDLGASVGWFSLYLARRFEKVLAVEAHPTTFEMLLRNIALHAAWDRVVPCCVAAWDTATTLEMCSETEIGWTLPSQTDLDGAVCASGVAFHPVRGNGSLRVPALAVDDLLAEDWPVRLVKIDVQGCDLRALWGLTRTLDRQRPVVLFEYESISKDWHGDDLPAYFAFFAEHRYSVRQIHPNFQDYEALPCA